MSSFAVAVRLKPVSHSESAAWSWTRDSIRSLDSCSDTEYRFSYICPPSESTKELYRAFVQPCVDRCWEGVHASVLAYGQTASGKTFTMVGTEHEPGLLMLAFSDLFQRRRMGEKREVVVKVAYMEIYNEMVNDLLNTANKDLILVDDPVMGCCKVNGLTEETVNSPSDFINLLLQGEQSRNVGSTDSNERSSRSHTIFRLQLLSKKKGAAKWDRQSFLHFVDLAGSESVHSGANASRALECKHINKSLLGLGRVMLALAEGKLEHIPYRETKLTRVLQLALDGKSFTYLICTICMAIEQKDESLNTIRFGSFAKKIQIAVKNEVYDEESQLIKYIHLVSDLKAKIKELDKTAKNAELKEKEIQRLQSSNKLMELKLKLELQSKAKLESRIKIMKTELESSKIVSAATRPIADSLCPLPLPCEETPKFHASLLIPFTEQVSRQNYNTNTSDSSNCSTFSETKYLEDGRNCSAFIDTASNVINHSLSRVPSSKTSLSASSLLMDKYRPRHPSNPGSPVTGHRKVAPFSASVNIATANGKKLLGNRSFIKFHPANSQKLQDPAMYTVLQRIQPKENQKDARLNEFESLAGNNLPKFSVSLDDIMKSAEIQTDASTIVGSASTGFLAPDESKVDSVEPSPDIVPFAEVNEPPLGIIDLEGREVKQTAEIELRLQLKQAEESVIMLSEKLARTGNVLDPQALTLPPNPVASTLNTQIVSTDPVFPVSNTLSIPKLDLISVDKESAHPSFEVKEPSSLALEPDSFQRPSVRSPTRPLRLFVSSPTFSLRRSSLAMVISTTASRRSRTSLSLSAQDRDRMERTRPSSLRPPLRIRSSVLKADLPSPNLPPRHYTTLGLASAKNKDSNSGRKSFGSEMETPKSPPSPGMLSPLTTGHPCSSKSPVPNLPQPSSNVGSTNHPELKSPCAPSLRSSRGRKLSGGMGVVSPISNLPRRVSISIPSNDPLAEVNDLIAKADVSIFTSPVVAKSQASSGRSRSGTKSGRHPMLLSMVEQVPLIFAVSAGFNHWKKYHFNKNGCVDVRVWADLSDKSKISFHWKSESILSRSNNSVPVNRIFSIMVGRNSKVFARNKRSEVLTDAEMSNLEARSFSLVCKDRSIDLTAPTVEEYQKMIDFLRLMQPDIELLSSHE